MATTEKGIYYPNDGTQPADVLGDMKKMAESIDEAINDNTYDDTEIKEDISKIKEEQEKQNKNIEKNVTNITALQEENANLKAQIPQGQAEGEEISLSDSAKMELVEFGLQGNSRQETTKGLQILEDTNAGTEGWNMSIQNGAFEMSKYTNLSDGIEACKFKCTESSSGYKVFYRDCNTEKLKNNTKYTLQLDVLSNKSFYLFVAIQTVAGQNKLINFVGKSYTTPGKWQTFKMVAESNDVAIVSSQILYLSVNTINTANDYFTIKNLILVEGDYSEQDLEWEKYSGVEIAPNLNFPQKIEAIGENGNVEINKSNKNIFEETDNTKLFNTAYVELVKGNFFLEPNTNYRISFDTNNNGGKVYINEYAFGKWGEAICDGKRHSIVSTSKITTPYFFEKTAVLKSSLNVENNYNISNVLIEKDTGDNINFIEHIGNKYTLPIQKPFYMLHFDGDVNISQKATVRDSFILKDGKWCEKHNIAKVNLEDINWYKGSAEAGTENTYKRWNSIAKYKDDKCGIAGSSNRLAISNYLANQYYKIFNVDKIGFNIENSEICIRFPISTANSPEEIKNFWQEKANEGNGAYILYPSKEPELTECTEEQVQVLEQIVKDGTYKGVTHYFTEDEVKPTLEVKYYKDLEMIINKQEQMQATLNNVQAQILELGGN